MSGRPRLFVFSREYPPVTVGGTSTVARSLGVGMTLQGWDVVVVTSNPTSEDDTRETIDGVIVHRVGSRVVYQRRSGLNDDSVLVHRRMYRAAMVLAEESGRPDVVALPDLFSYPEAALFARRVGVPLINVLLQDFGTLTRYDRGRHQVSSGVSARREHLLEVEGKSLAGSDFVVFISQALEQAITASYPGLMTPHKVVHLGVDEAEIHAVAEDAEGRMRLRGEMAPQAWERPLIVACGRLVPVKGFAQLLQAVAALPEVGPAPQLVIVGVGPEEAALRASARQLGIGDRVTFAGDVLRRSALAWMSMATVAVVPSLWESFCYVCAEMMALGAPVVATAVDSLNELIPSDAFGYRVPVTDREGAREIDPLVLADRIAEVLADREEASRRAARGRDRILGQFTNDRFATNMAAVCSSFRAGTS